MLDRSAKDHVCSAVDALHEELTRLGLDLGNIEAPLGKEREAGNYVYEWMAQNGFRPERIGVYEDRFNVLTAGVPSDPKLLDAPAFVTLDTRLAWNASRDFSASALQPLNHSSSMTRR